MRDDISDGPVLLFALGQRVFEGRFAYIFERAVEDIIRGRSLEFTQKERC